MAHLNAFRELAKARSHSRPTEPAAAAYLVAVGHKSPRAGVLLDELIEPATGAAIERDALLAAAMIGNSRRTILSLRHQLMGTSDFLQ